MAAIMLLTGAVLVAVFVFNPGHVGMGVAGILLLVLGSMGVN